MRILGIVSRRAEFFSHHSENLTLATDNSSWNLVWRSCHWDQVIRWKY
jgi:hypothetical protein